MVSIITGVVGVREPQNEVRVPVLQHEPVLGRAQDATDVEVFGGAASAGSHFGSRALT